MVQKSLILILLILIVFPVISQEIPTVTVSWLPNTEPDLAGYKVYIGEAPRQYIAAPRNAGVDTFITYSKLFINHLGKTLYFAVTAYDTAGNESAYSEEVSFYVNPALLNPAQIDTTKPGIPKNIKVNINIIITYQ